jgi:hypothetical protein
MKITEDIPDSLLEQAKRLAVQEHSTVRALMEEGLQLSTLDCLRRRISNLLG